MGQLCDNIDSVYNRICQASAHSILVSTPDILAESNLGDRWWNPPIKEKDPARYEQAYHEYRTTRQEVLERIYRNRCDTVLTNGALKRLDDQRNEIYNQLRHLNIDDPTYGDKLRILADQLSDINSELRP